MRFNIKSKYYDCNDEFPLIDNKNKWSLSIIGENEDLDDRSKRACDFIRSISNKILSFSLNVQKNNFLINKEIKSSGALRLELKHNKSIILDATTLTYPEILIILDAAVKEKVQKINFLYLEPQEYRRKIGYLSEYRSFTLSENQMYKAIPKFNVNLNSIEKGRVVFFLGYEESRLIQAFEQQETLNKWEKSVVFGIPAFSYGMELDSIANNAQYLQNDFSLHYVAASSVLGSYKLLNKLRSYDKEDNPIAVIPLGTKPHAIGAALFVIEHNQGDNAITIFDHPNRTQGRTLKIKRWHLYEVVDTQI